jgi:sulfate transport system permease protein
MKATKTRKSRSGSIPGFGLSMGFTLLYLSLIVLIPLASLFLKAAGLSWSAIWHTVTDPRVVASYRLSFGASLLAALVNGVFGFAVAWVLVRYRFPGRKLLDAIVDMPFALPTAVAGMALTTLYSPGGWIGKLAAPIGLKTAYSPLGITIALIFIGIPFVVRTVQPVLEELDRETEEAAVSLGAYRARTFVRVLLPQLLPALIAGMTMAFARAVGEYGSVVFISGNMPFKTEIAPLLIMTKLEQFDYAGATAIAAVMLVVSFVLLLATNVLQARMQRRLAQR